MKERRKRPGPKPKPKSRRQSECVMVRLTRSEHAGLKRDANRAGESLGGYLRKLWLDQKGA